MKPASVVIMDEQPIVRMSIEVLLQKNSQIRVVLKSDDGKEVIDYVRKNETDLVIVDIELPGTDGFHCSNGSMTSAQKQRFCFYHRSRKTIMPDGRSARAPMVLSVKERTIMTSIKQWTCCWQVILSSRRIP